jgi:hypothetical protein
MKRQNHFKLLSFFGMLIGLMFILPSCGSSETDSLEKEAIDNAKEIFQNLPELKEEIDEYKEKVNAQEISGNFVGELNGESFEFNSWQGEKSRISFIEFTGVIHATISRKPQENVTIKVSANKWYEKETPYKIPASIYAMEGTDHLVVTYTKKDSDGEYLKQFQTMDGELIVHQFDETGVKISFDGNGIIGDPRQQNKVPLTFELDLDYNFVSSDVRTNK